MIAPWRNEKIKVVYERPEIRASVEIILSVFTVVGLLTLAIRPTLATVATLQKKIEDQTIVDNKLGTKITQLARANTDLSTYADRVADYSLAVTDTHDESGLAKRIAVIANESSVTINSLTLNAVPLIGQLINLANKDKGAMKPPTEKDGKVASFLIDFDVSGAPALIYDFLAKLENMDRIVLISTVNLKKEETKATAATPTAGNSLRATIKAMGYYVLAPPQ